MVKKIRKIVIMMCVAIMLFTNYCFATGVAESQLAIGTENLIRDFEKSLNESYRANEKEIRRGIATQGIPRAERSPAPR